jgi:hypothetical protein
VLEQAWINPILQPELFASLVRAVDDLQDAIAWLDDVVNVDHDPAPYGSLRQALASFAAFACACARDTPAAKYVRSWLRPFAGSVSTFGALGTSLAATDRFLAMLAATERDWEEAERLYRSAIDLETRLGSPVFLAHTHLWYGRMLLERDGPGDRERGVEFLTEALATASQLGMAFVEREARRLLRPPLSKA